jgi:uncharacterized protein (TIGR00297 family)
MLLSLKTMITTNITLIIILLMASYASYTTGKLTLAGAITGGIVALCIYLGAGFIGITMLAVFFLLSVLATSHKKNFKLKYFKTEQPQKRDAWQVLANGGLAAFTSVLAYVFTGNSLRGAALVAAALASATADTLSSELGTVYGKRFYSIITFKSDVKGRDGVISLEGTLIGLAGSAAIAAVYSIGYGWNVTFLNILLAGTIGNIADSVLGATLERNGYINNNMVNLLNTLVSVVCYCLLATL